MNKKLNSTVRSNREAIKKRHVRGNAASSSRDSKERENRFSVPSASMGAAIVASIVALVWSYWPSFTEMASVWAANADYSHGYLVVPVALCFLYFRRDGISTTDIQPAPLLGLGIVIAGLAIRYVGGRLFYGPIENWSILVLLSGVVLALAGRRVFIWALPAILFLLFMMPLPFQMEVAMRQPLQALATTISSMTLITLGFPAIAEANVIRIGDVQYGVEEACSGLRIFVGITALAFAYIVLIKRHWLVKLILVLAILPVTLLANTLRIVGTCMLMEWYSNDAIQKASHDLAGFLMIPLAAAMFGIVLWYLGRLIREESVISSSEAIRSSGKYVLRRPN